MKKRRITVDFEAVWDALDERRREDGLTWTQLAKHLEVADMRLSSMKWRGKGVSAHVLAGMMVFLNRDLRDFLKQDELVA